MPMTDMDRVRLEIGDNEAPMHFADDEIWEKISQAGGDWVMAAGELCLAWARYILTHQPDFTIGRFSETGWREAARLLNEKGQELIDKAEAATALAAVGAYAGAISVADKAAKRADTNRTQGAFRRGQFDNPNAG